MKLESEIREIVSNIIQIPPEEIDPKASFFDEYGMDSLRALEILAEIENTYSITIDPEKLLAMTSLEEVIKITQELLNQNAGTPG